MCQKWGAPPPPRGGARGDPCTRPGGGMLETPDIYVPGPGPPPPRVGHNIGAPVALELFSRPPLWLEMLGVPHLAPGTYMSQGCLPPPLGRVSCSPSGAALPPLWLQIWALRCSILALPLLLLSALAPCGWRFGAGAPPADSALAPCGWRFGARAPPADELSRPLWVEIRCWSASC